MGYSELSPDRLGLRPAGPVPAADPLGQTAYAGTKFFFGCGPCTVGGIDVASSLRYVAVVSTPPVLS